MGTIINADGPFEDIENKYDRAKEIVESIFSKGSNPNIKTPNINFCELSLKFMCDCNLITNEIINHMKEYNIDLGGNVSEEGKIGILAETREKFTNNILSGETLKLIFGGKEYYVSNNWTTYDKKWKFAKWIFNQAGMTKEEVEELESDYNKRKKELESDYNKRKKSYDESKNQSSQNSEANDGDGSQLDESVEESQTVGHNLIIYGAPGTGKSHWVEENYGKENLTRVVFHPEYTYFDFVGQYRPCPVYEKDSPRKFAKASDAEPDVVDVVGEPFIDYRFVPGPFTDVLVKAWKEKKAKEKKANEESPAMYTLLIEELNRADAAAVFGDVFQLLDRDSNGKSEYGIVPSEEWGAYLKSAEVTLPEGKVEIPSNMNIIATMNSADQGVHMLDTAFKRRWDYHFMSIDEGLNSGELKDIKVRYAGTDIDWKQFITILNEKLADDFQIPEDRLIGPFFVKPKIVKKDSEKAIKKILFYLWDDVLRNSSGRNQFFKGITTMSQLYKDFDKGEDVMGIKDKLGSNTENSGQA